RRHRLDVGFYRPRSANGARTGSLLWRHGAPEERFGNHDAQHGRPRHHRPPVVSIWLLPGVWRFARGHHRLVIEIFGAERRYVGRTFSRHAHSHLCPLHVSRHVRHHHAGPDQRCHRGADPFRTLLSIHFFVGHVGV